MDAALISSLEHALHTSIGKCIPVSGGDISNAYQLHTHDSILFCKTNNDPLGYDMFLAEADGLQMISKTKTIAVPRVVLVHTFDSTAVLVMEYIPSKRPTSIDYGHLGTALAHLHQQTTDTFGWHQDNFIGSLPQPNTPHKNWVLFYVQERLMPQLVLARNRNLLNASDIPTVNRMEHILSSLFPECTPSLLHGDLWSGNFLISEDGKPNLIDPAACYGHNEMDLAMTLLFGGFGASFYQTYHEHIPKATGYENRYEVYQLYYLLVHLNLFGKSYMGAVNQILKRYF